MKCPRCLNTDETYFYHGERGWYCRKCIAFGVVMLEEENEPVSLETPKEGSEEYVLQYPLTPAQQKISDQCAQLIDTDDILLNCICGAGKTELVVASISKMLAKRKKVCFAIPRRQVVLELRERLAEYFPHAKVIAVCGGHTKETDGDLIICTTHQLYRYYQAFDLLILDEPDAFPFAGSDVLHGIAETACRGHRIFLTATADDILKERVKKGEMKELDLYRRPHGHDLPVPEVHLGFGIILFVRMLVWLKKHDEHPRMVFVPSIRMADIMHRILKFFMDCDVLTSRSENRDEVIAEFRKKKAGVIVSTTVLERGVTIPGADICVFHAESDVFSEASLIQMAGRAGRSFAYPDGDVLFLCTEKRKHVYDCVKTIREANACAV